MSRFQFVGAVRDEKAKKANASYYVLGNARNFMNEHKQNTYLNTMRNEGKIYLF